MVRNSPVVDILVCPSLTVVVRVAICVANLILMNKDLEVFPCRPQRAYYDICASAAVHRHVTAGIRNDAICRIIANPTRNLEARSLDDLVRGGPSNRASL